MSSTVYSAMNVFWLTTFLEHTQGSVLEAYGLSCIFAILKTCQNIQRMVERDKHGQEEKMNTALTTTKKRKRVM
jgi:hypothetical protein